MIANLLREPLLKTVNIDGEDRIAAHRKILESKTMMKEVCQEMYGLCASLENQYLTGTGRRIELGAGVSFIKDHFADVEVTDVVPAPHLDLVLDAQKMDGVADGSVRAFYGIHCFHHFPQPRAFLSELQRTLSVGGGCILIEPYFGAVSKLLYPNLFASERFDMAQTEWENPTAGSMSDANQALSYIVFFRDRAKFEREFPDLRIVHRSPIANYLRYLLSGGLNFRSLVPAPLAPILKGLEWVLSPLSSALALHHVVVIQKQPLQ